MKRTHVTAASLALCLGFPATGLPAADIWQRDEALQAAVTGPTDPWRTRLHEALAGPPARIRTLLDQLLEDGALSLPARERVLFDFAASLRLAEPDGAARAALDWLADYRARVLVPHPEAGVQFPVPLYPVAEASRGTDNAWRYRAARRQTFESIENKDLQAIDLTKVSDPAARRGSLDAFRRAPVEALAPLRDELLARLRAGESLAGPAAIAADRLGDPDLYAAVLASGDQQAALGLLPRVVDRFGAEDAYRLLSVGLANDALASASLLQLGRLYARVPEAGERLFDLLGDRRLGGSAAAALARIPDPAVVGRVDELLAGSTDRMTQARAILALQLNGSEPAVKALQRFTERTDTDGQLQREVNEWLKK